MDLDYVCSSECYPLVSLNTIRKNMVKLLQEKEALLPSVEIEKKEAALEN